MISRLTDGAEAGVGQVSTHLTWPVAHLYRNFYERFGVSDASVNHIIIGAWPTYNRCYGLIHHNSLFLCAEAER